MTEAPDPKPEPGDPALRHVPQTVPPMDVGPDIEELYRNEITGAMNAVVRTCRDIVNEHTHRGFWTPTGNAPNHADLINQARARILDKLQMVIDCFNIIAVEIELDRQPRQVSPPGE